MTSHLARLHQEHHAPRGALRDDLTRPILTPADVRGIAAALALASVHHPNMDLPRLRELADRLAPDAALYFDAIRAERGEPDDDEEHGR